MNTLDERLKKMAASETLDSRLENMRNGTGTQSAPSSSAPRVGTSAAQIAQTVARNRAEAAKTGAPVLGATGVNRREVAKSSRGVQQGHTIVKQPQNRFGGGAGRGSISQEEAEVGVKAAKEHKIEDFSAAKLAGGIATKGVDSAMSGLTSTAEWLVGQNITGLGKKLGQNWSNNPVSALNRRVQKAKQTNQDYFKPNVERGGRAAEIADKYGTATVAAVPQALAAIATAGSSTAAETGTAGLQAASTAVKSGGTLFKTIVQKLAKDPQYWLAFSQVAGDSYQQAKADGASDAAANLYALANGLGNAAIEVGGGIQTLPKELQKTGSALKAWAESAVAEGNEEVTQGILERGLQNLIYQKKNPLASVTDGNAVLNPRTAAGEFAGGAVVGGILGGGQTLINRAVNPPKSYVELTKDGVRLAGAQKNTASVLETVNFDDPAASDGKGAVSLLRDSVRDMVDMEPVASVNGTEISSEGRATERVMDFLQNLKDKVVRPGFGEVLFSKSKVKNSLVGHGTGEAKIELFAAVPAVIQQGKQIAYRENWKGRGYDSFVFAAPVEYRGETAYVTAIVVRDNANRYYLHEAVDQNGNLIYGHGESPDAASDGPEVSSKSTVADTELSTANVAQGNGKSNGKTGENDFNVQDENTSENPAQNPQNASFDEMVRNIRNSPLPRAMQDELIRANEQVGKLPAGTLEKERAAVENPTEISKETKSGAKKQTLEEFLGEKGFAAPMSDYMIDKMKIPHGQTQREQTKMQLEAQQEAEKYAALRENAIQEYQEKVNKGEIVGKTRAEKLMETANGHEDNSAVQAARRLLEKQGINWETGKPMNVEGLYQKAPVDAAGTQSAAETQPIYDGQNSKTADFKALEQAKKAAGAVKDIEMPRLETADVLVQNKTAGTVIENAKNGTVQAKSVIEAPKIETQGAAQNIQQSALDKLGVHPVGDMADYTGTEFLRGEEKGEKDTAKARARAEARLQPSKGEKIFAKGIANGDFTVEDIPSTMNRATVTEIADYYQAEDSFKRTGGVQKRGGEIRGKTEQMAEQYFKDQDKYKPISMLVMNERTPERVMRSVFGDEQGERINEAYIYPVQQNEAEKTRFIQRQLDQVRTFEDSTGKRSRLTKEERSVVQQIMEDRFVNETVASMEVSGAIKNAAENIGKGEDPADAGREFSLNAEERELAQRLARWTRNREMLESGKLDSKKINNAVEKFSEQYDLFYNAVNDFLTAHGYGTIGFIKGYAPHMQGADTQNKLLSALRAMGVNTDASSLPTSISGLTADYKPGKRWNPFFQSRVGDTTDYDVSKGYESYVSYLADILYHTDDIARLRGVSRYLRKTFGPEEINHAIDHAESLRDANLDTQIEVLKDAGKISEGTKLTYPDAKKMMDEYIDDLYDNVTKTTKYGELVKYIDNYANLLAGKQSMADRGMEYMAGRTSLNAGNKLVSMFGRAQVAGNLSSVLNQTAQIPQIMAEVKGKYIRQAVSDLAKETGGKLWDIKNTGIFDQSDLLTGKKGIEYLTADDNKLDKLVSAIFKPADIMDSTVSALAVRSKYNQLIAEGTPHEVAELEADRWATQVMASRMKGSRPMAFESKSVVNQMLHMFQVEASNSFEHLTNDLPYQYRKTAKNYGKGAAARAVATVVTKGLVSAFVLNRVAEAAYGGTPAPFDLLGYLSNFFASGAEQSANGWLKSMVNTVWKKMFGTALLGDDDNDKEKKPFNMGAAVSDTLYNVSNDIPFVRNTAGILGLGDQTMPFTNIADAAKGVAQAVTAEKHTGGEITGSLLELGSTLIPGGRQLQKTAQGIQTMSQGSRAYGYGENQRMQYPVPQTPGKWAQGLMFGNSGLSETRDFYASGNTGLTAKQTQTARDMAETGSDLVTVYDTIQSLRRKDPGTGEQPDTQTKLARLNEAKLSDAEKLRLYTDVIATSESKRPEEFRNLMKKGMSWGQVSKAYTMYLNLNEDDDMSAGEKATRFASWADGKNLSEKQRKGILDSMAFYSQAKAEAKRYTAMTEAGLSSDAAEGLTLRISKLEPEAGKQDVSDLQRYNAVVKYGLTEPEQMAALESMMEDSEYERLENAYNAGVSPKTFVEFKQKTDGLAADKSNGKTVTGSKKAKVLNAINSMQLTNEQKTALYYAAGYKISTLYDAPWVGGRQTGITMPRLNSGSPSGGTSRVKTGTALDKYSLGNSLDKYDIMPKLK